MNERCHLLYIDDPESQLAFQALFRRKFPIFTVEHLTEARWYIKHHQIGIVLSYDPFPNKQTTDFFQWIRGFDETIIRIQINGIFYFQQVMEIENNPGLVHQRLYKPWNSDQLTAILIKWWSIYQNQQTPH